MIRLDRPDVTRLAADYSAAVRASLTASQLLNVRNGDAVAADYVDTGELLAEAIYDQRPNAESITDYADEMIEAERRASDAGYRLSRVLVACEYSATVRDAFAACGHAAESCDILPSENPHGIHHQRDARELLNDGYHMMVAHPPCTYLCNSGVKHLVRGGQRINPDRWQAMREGADFFLDLLTAPIARVAVENPIMHKYAREIVGRKADQYVQPYEFGHDVSKKTGLWLDGLPKLTADPADYVEPRIETYRGKTVKRWANQSPCGADSAPPSADRGHKRSAFFAGLARAMAEQWGGLKTRAAASVTPLAARA